LVAPPADFDADATGIWLETQEHLEKQHIWEESDAATLERYVRCLVRAKTARNAVESQFVEGSMGQMVAHPGLKLAREAERDAHVYAESLLLTPQMRKRHEITARDTADDLEKLI
jgi:P27 family predicted phage terminase small subunit